MLNSPTECQLQGVNTQALVPLVRRLIAIIGISHTLRLLEQRGGTPLHIPVNADRAMVLNALLPTEAVQELCKALPGEWLNLPKADRIVRQVRDYYLRQDRAHMSAPKVAVKYKLTVRQVINICNYDDDRVMVAARDDSPQVDLFE